MSDLIERQAAIDALRDAQHRVTVADEAGGFGTVKWSENVIYFAAAERVLSYLPSVQPTLCGYDIEHLELIARVLQKEDLPPERVVEALTDMGRIVAIVKDEFEEALKKEVWEYGRDRLD